MDRIFLQMLVRELAPLVVGQRIRAIGVDRDRRALELRTGSSAQPSLVVSFLPEASGIFRARLTHSDTPPPRLNKPLVGSRIAGIDMDRCDRVITLRIDQTRLSGRKVELSLKLEVLATRTDLYLLDPRGIVLEALSSSRPRLGVAETYTPLPPPPGASAMAENVETFEKRRSKLTAVAPPTKSDWLFISGMSPLLVDELRELIHAGHSPATAFQSLTDRLAERAPVLYLRPRGSDGGKPCVLSPLSLDRFRDWKAREFGTFEEALSAAFDLVGSATTMGSAHQRLDSALRRAVAKSRKLHAKLSAQKTALTEPTELRRHGECILAGLRSATVLPGGWVELPDPFDAAGGTIRVRVDPRLSLTANAERYFRRSRKAERTAVELGERLSRLENEIDYLEGLQLDLLDARTLPEIEELTDELTRHGLLPRARGENRPRRRAPERRLPPRRFQTPQGNIVLVGRSGRSNDELTFRLAGPADLWFHVLDSPGSHVVLKRAEDVEPGESEMLWAAAIAAHFSKRRDDTHVDVMVTERRHVHKMKGGPPGLVRVSQWETLRVSPAKEPEEQRE